MYEFLDRLCVAIPRIKDFKAFQKSDGRALYYWLRRINFQVNVDDITSAKDEHYFYNGSKSDDDSLLIEKVRFSI